jgi:4-hydroxythreonine-4-phosphate dehydrogenase
MSKHIPRIGILLGDPSGVGPELVAKLLATPNLAPHASAIVLGDQRILKMGHDIIGKNVDIPIIQDIQEITFKAGQISFLDYPTFSHEEVTLGEMNPQAGASVYKTLLYTLELARKSQLDGFTFAPFNKQAMHLGGCPFESEFLLFLNAFRKTGIHGEINVLDELWTTRVTSHIALKDVAGFIKEQRVFETIVFLHDNLQKYGKPQPHIAVAGLNPHCGENGLFGREEIDEIAPAIERARTEGIDVLGPYPADTLFLRVEKEQIDGIISMYHDQGQVATKLLGFDRGVTVHGGLPIPITTPAHGTAFDIAGQGKANPAAIQRAFSIACQIAANQIDKESKV